MPHAQERKLRTSRRGRSTPKRLATILLAIALLACLLPGLVSADARFHGGRVYVAWRACTGQRYRPSSIVFACGDGGLWATNIRYTRYGGRTAFARVELHAHSCIPNCAESAFHTFPGTVELHAVARCEGTLFYTRARYRFLNGSPYGGSASAQADIEPFGKDFKPICGPVLG